MATVLSTTTANALLTLVLKDCGAFSSGQTPLAEDMNDALFSLNMMLGQWNHQRWLIYNTVDTSFVSDGRMVPYTVGPGQNFNVTVRPDRLETGCFLRQVTQPAPNQPDFPLEVLQSREDYNNVALKKLQSFPWFVFYDPAYPTGLLYCYPWPQASIYEVHIMTKTVLAEIRTLATVISLPDEYFEAIFYNMIVRLGIRYPITRDPVMLEQWNSIKRLARASLNVLRGGNTAVARLGMPPGLNRPGIYNIFSDQIR